MSIAPSPASAINTTIAGLSSLLFAVQYCSLLHALEVCVFVCVNATLLVWVKNA